MQKHLIPHNTISHDFYVRENLLCPIFAHSLTNVRSRYFVSLSHFESRDAAKIFSIITFHFVHSDASQHIAWVVSRVGYHGRVRVFVRLFLCPKVAM